MIPIEQFKIEMVRFQTKQHTSRLFERTHCSDVEYTKSKEHGAWEDLNRRVVLRHMLHSFSFFVSYWLFDGGQRAQNTEGIQKKIVSPAKRLVLKFLLPTVR